MKYPRKVYALPALIIAVIVLLASTNCNTKAADCATAVNKYAIALQAFQQAEIKMHDAGRVSDFDHHNILVAEQAASRSGHALDAAISAANSGGDPQQYIDIATQTFSAMLSEIRGTDVDANTQLIAEANLAGDALKNAITLIQALKAQHPTKTSNAGYLRLWVALFLPLFGFAAIGGLSANQAIQLLQIATELEPIAFDLIVKLAQSMKGKSAEEIVAMSESIFNQVDQTAQDQLNLLDKKQ